MVHPRRTDRAIAVIANLSGGDDDGDSTATTDSSDSSDDNASSDDAGSADDAADEESSNDEQEEEAANPYEETYGDFKVIKKNGSGDTTIKLPAKAKATAGLVKATHDGSSNFVITPLDESNQPADLLVNTIGSYSGTTAYGGDLTFGDATKLQVQADGSWTVRVKPVASAKELPENASGKGDAVFVFSGGAEDWKAEHSGESNFIVIQHTDGMPGVTINEIGNYSGTVPAVEGPSVVTIQADGDWSITRQ